MAPSFADGSGVSVELLQMNGAEGQSDQALVVSGIAEGGPAARAGLEAGDIIAAINGSRVKRWAPNHASNRQAAPWRTNLQST